jgi:glutamyl-tRNA reductase
MGRGALKDLRKRGVTQLLLANRTRSTAESIAAQSGGTVYGLDELPAALRIADIVICATSASLPILTAPVVREAIAARPQTELVVLDLSVPRNVEPTVATLPGARLFDVDDLQIRLDASLADRRREMPKVESIVEEELVALDRELRQMTILPLISDLRQKAESIRLRELARTLSFLRAADPQVIEHVQHLSHSLVNGLLHGPTVRLRELATDGVTTDHAAAVRDLFGLES